MSFVFLTCLALLPLAVDTGRKAHMALAAGFLLLGLLSKENAITFLAIAPLSIYFTRSQSWKSSLAPCITMILSAGIFLWIRKMVLGPASLSAVSMELMNNPFIKLDGTGYVAFTTSERAITILWCLLEYIRLLVWPFALTHDYYPRYFEIPEGIDVRAILSSMLYLGVTVVAIIGLIRKRIWAFGILFS